MIVKALLWIAVAGAALGEFVLGIVPVLVGPAPRPADSYPCPPGANASYGGLISSHCGPMLPVPPASQQPATR